MGYGIGVFIDSSEYHPDFTNKNRWLIDDLTVTITATATNL